MKIILVNSELTIRNRFCNSYHPTSVCDNLEFKLGHGSVCQCIAFGFTERIIYGAEATSVVHRTHVDPMPRGRVAVLDGFADGLVEAGALSVREAGADRGRFDVLVWFRLEVSVGQGQFVVLVLLGLEGVEKKVREELD